jgi:molybdopterin-containing oxidoreductase family iron-sulfur binding subunit
VPAAHFLETWGDTRSYDGTITIMQPLIEPLHEGKSAYEVLALFSDQYDRRPYDIVKSYWQTQKPGADFETWWRQSIHDGFLAESALPAKTVSVSGQIQNQSVPSVAADGYELDLRRPLRQQRLVTGAAEAVDESDVGQRRHRQSQFSECDRRHQGQPRRR